MRPLPAPVRCRAACACVRACRVAFGAAFSRTMSAAAPVAGKRPAEELYDLRTDPDQLTNVAGTPERAATQADLSRRLMAELQRLGDPRVSDDVIFERSPFTDPRERRKP